MIKRLLFAILFLLVISKILACSFGYILHGNIANYSIFFVLQVWFYLDKLAIYSQLLIYFMLIAYGLITYKCIVYILNTSIKKEIIQDLHGSANFLEFQDVKKTNLLHNSGVFIGGIEDKKGNTYYLRNNDNAPSLLLAPTRSGKGVCVVIPTLLTWEHACIVYDIKRELYHLTHKWRGSSNGANNNIYRFDPAEKDSHCFNPLNEIRIGTEYQIADTQNIAYMLVDTLGKGIEGHHWLESAFTLFTGCILYICNKNYDIDKTQGDLTQILELLCDEEGIKNTAQILANFTCVSEDAQKTINLIGREMLGKENEELSGIFSTTTTKLSLYHDPLVARAISNSDFTIDDICNKENPATLYLVVDPNNKDRYQPLTRLIINMILRKLTTKMNFIDGKGQSPNKYRLLLLLDEFPSLGRIPILEDSLAFMAGYGIKALLIAQDLNQIYAKYEKYESIIANCHTITAFAANNPDTNQWLSRQLGDTTIIKKNYNISGKRTDIMLSNKSTSYTEIRRNLMTPEEIKTMPSLKFDLNNNLISTGNMLILINGEKPIFGKQIPFFLDDEFNKRIQF